MGRTWSDLVEERAKTFDLAAKLNASTKSDPVACAWHAKVLREMAGALDRDARERGEVVMRVRLFGLKFTVSRDG